MYGFVVLFQWLTVPAAIQTGSNLTKYENYVLPGGITVNGEKIYNDAVLEVERLENKLRDTYEAPPTMLVG